MSRSKPEDDARVRDMLRIEVEREKQEYLLELVKFKQAGIELTRHYTMDDSLEDIEFEYTRIKTHLDTANNVSFMRDSMFLAFQGIEMANAKWGPVLHLNGWSREVQADKKRYDHVLERLYKKHWRLGNMSPEAELSWLIGSSMMMHHFKHKWGFGHVGAVTDAPGDKSKPKFDLGSMLGMFMPGLGGGGGGGGGGVPRAAASVPSTPMHAPPPPAHAMPPPPPPLSAMRAPPPPPTRVATTLANQGPRPSDVLLTPPPGASAGLQPERDPFARGSPLQPPPPQVDDGLRRELEAARAMVAQSQRAQSQSEAQINMMRQQMQGMMQTLHQQQQALQQQQLEQQRARAEADQRKPELVVHTGEVVAPLVPPAPRNAPQPQVQGQVQRTPLVESVPEGSSVFNMSSSSDDSSSSSSSDEDKAVKRPAPRTPQTPARKLSDSDDRDISIVGSARRRTPAGGRGRGTPARAASPSSVDALRLDL